MNGTRPGQLTTAIDASGFAQVDCGNGATRTYFLPARFAAPWNIPGVGDWVMVELPHGGREPHALWQIRTGIPSYTYTAGGA